MDLFGSLVPHLFLVVQAGAPLGGSCTAAQPCGSIQAAVAQARPGTAVLVRAGTYAEAVKFPSRQGGTEGAPIWLVSADGPGRATIVVPPGARAAIQGLGVQDVAVVGFTVVGGQNGIQFSMSGDGSRDPGAWSVPHATGARIAVLGNTLRGQNPGDAIKVSQAVDVEVADNTVADVGDQCVDFVAVNRGVIANNDCAGSRKAAAIFAKGGSQDVTISGNAVHDIEAPKVAGIAMGGWTKPGGGYFWPGQRDFEVRRLRVTGNRVERVNGLPLSVLGAQDSVAENNWLDAGRSATYAVVGLSHGSPGQPWAWPRDLRFSGNVLLGKPLLFLQEKGRDATGRAMIDLERDHIAVQDASAPPPARPPAVGPGPFHAWRGQVSYPILPPAP